MSYDHIVIGAGSSGSVFASQLSRDPGCRVLLVEAGPDWPDAQSLPQDIANALTVSVEDHDWGYTAEVVAGRRLAYPRGKAVGGCSAVNGTIALRGIPADYDEWAALGNHEWSWDKVLPYLIQLEDDRDIEGPLRGQGGPVPVVRWADEELVPFQRAYLQACQDLGFGYVADHNAPDSTGVGPIPMNRRGAVRISAALSHLLPARSRSNLEVRSQCLVHRVLFDGVRAVGVQVESGGTVERIYGDHITLSAGAIGTPALLLRSGIGPEDQLRRLGIPVVLPRKGVGANLIEHQQIAVGLIPKPGVTNPADPDVQIMLRHTAPNTTQFNNMQTYVVSREVPASHRPISVMSVLQKPESRGRVTLTSTNPRVQPHIWLDSFGDIDDRRIALDGARLCWEIANSKPIRELSDGTTDTLTAAQVKDDTEMFGYIRRNSATIGHPVGTCRMGEDAGPGAVVDQYLRVHGADGLSVVDASVMPTHVSADPNLTCYVIGERAADWSRWRRRRSPRLTPGWKTVMRGALMSNPDEPQSHSSSRREPERIAVLIEEHFDATEFRAFNEVFPTYGYIVEYVSRLWGNEARTFAANAESGEISEWVTVTTDVADVEAADYAGVIAIGGYAMDRLRYNEHVPAATAPAVTFLRRAMSTPGVVVGALCHGLWLWCALPSLLHGRRVTCAHNIVSDVENAGGTVVFIDGRTADVVVDANLVTARHPESVHEFMAAFMVEIDRYRTPRDAARNHHG